MRNSILNQTANKNFFKKFLKDFMKILFFWKILNFDKDRDNEKEIFLNLKSTVCSQDFFYKTARGRFSIWSSYFIIFS